MELALATTVHDFSAWNGGESGLSVPTGLRCRIDVGVCVYCRERPLSGLRLSCLSCACCGRPRHEKPQGQPPATSSRRQVAPSESGSPWRVLDFKLAAEEARCIRQAKLDPSGRHSTSAIHHKVSRGCEYSVDHGITLLDPDRYNIRL